LIDVLLARNYHQPRAEEIAKHGLARRLQMIRHCIRRTFEILPPETTEPDRDDLMDATAFLHTFIFNLYGAIDNAARLWCIEADLRLASGKPLRKFDIGLTQNHAIVRSSLSASFQLFLSNINDWFCYLESYRHALAHRIPLYIPPKCLNADEVRKFERFNKLLDNSTDTPDLYKQHHAEQAKIGKFSPQIMHSYSDGARPIFLHAQMICDYSTVIEIGEWMTKELTIMSA